MRHLIKSALLAAVVATAASACGADSSSPQATSPPPSPATTSSSAAPSSNAPEASPLQAACTRYEGAQGTAHQVAASAVKPILASGPALFLINVRQTADEAASTVPKHAAAFTELRDAIDDLNQQATAALPPGADGTKTLVTVNPARLSAALDATDKLCSSS